MSEQYLHWYALIVRSRHEFVAESQLKKQGIEAFLPSVTKIRQWSDRKKAVSFPLFPGYLFVHVPRSAEAYLNVVRTIGVVALVSQEPGKPTPVDAVEMHSLILALSGGREIDVYPHLAVGAKVLIKRGPLQGAEGILSNKQDRHQFLVNVEILGRSIGVRVDADDLDLN